MTNDELTLEVKEEIFMRCLAELQVEQESTSLQDIDCFSEE